MFYSDVVACTTSLAAAVATYTRLWALPSGHLWYQSMADFLLAPDLVLTQIVMFVNFIAVMLMLGLMARRAGLYYRYRMQLCVLNRLLRAMLQILVVRTPATVGYMTLAVARRSLFLDPAGKALAVVLAHPMVFQMQQVLFVLPLRFMLPLQLYNIVVAMQWSKSLPCILQHAAAEASTPPHLVTAAEKVCVSAQSWAAVLQAAAAAPDGLLPMLSSTACEGVRSVHTLHIFATLCCVLLLPVGAVFGLEACLQTNLQDRSSNSSNSTVRNTSASAASTSRGSGRGSSMPSFVTAPGVLSVSSSQGFAGQGSSRQAAPAARVPLDGLLPSLASTPQPLHKFFCVLLVPVALAATWLLAELLSGLFAARVDCGALLRTMGLVDS